jgi:hypothetical protein
LRLQNADRDGRREDADEGDYHHHLYERQPARRESLGTRREKTNREQRTGMGTQNEMGIRPACACAPRSRSLFSVLCSLFVLFSGKNRYCH